MIKVFNILICLLVSGSTLIAQEYSTQELTINPHIDGTLLLPKNQNSSKLVILIAGSGPTDRDGNQSFMKNDNLKKIAEFLSSAGIASFRYDKRIVKQIRSGNIDKNILFDDFVTDARSVVDYFKSKYETIIIAGHSQGSLVGLLAVGEVASGFISLAGPGKSIDEVLIDQISKTAPMFLEDTKRVLTSLKKGQTTNDYPPALASIFNVDIQPFMINWMQYNPTQILSELSIPSLIINGDKDLQVGVDEATMLHENAQDGTLIIVKNMNHVLFNIEGGDLENAKSYNDNTLEIADEVKKNMIMFIENL